MHRSTSRKSVKDFSVDRKIKFEHFFLMFRRFVDIGDALALPGLEVVSVQTTGSDASLTCALVFGFVFTDERHRADKFEVRAEAAIETEIVLEK